MQTLLPFKSKPRILHSAVSSLISGTIFSLTNKCIFIAKFFQNSLGFSQ